MFREALKRKLKCEELMITLSEKGQNTWIIDLSMSK